MALTDKQKVLATTALKIKLENQFIPILKRFFLLVSTDLSNYYQKTGSLAAFAQYQLELQALLLQQYRKVNAAFKKTFRQNIPTDQNIQIPDTVDNEINTQLTSYNTSRAPAMAAFIAATMQNDAQAVLQNITNALILQNQPVTNRTVGIALKPQLKQRLYNHAPTVALTETQNIAETTKNIEATAVTQGITINGAPLADNKLKKTWFAILDDRTRAWHAAADSQTVSNNEPFIVNGEQLMYPGDTSLGASLNNIINCRCSSETSVDLT